MHEFLILKHLVHGFFKTVLLHELIEVVKRKRKAIGHGYALKMRVHHLAQISALRAVSNDGTFTLFAQARDFLYGKIRARLHHIKPLAQSSLVFVKNVVVSLLDSVTV